ncbi:helix-hairpin-helix domain-containing protein [Paenibacillus pinistramenti]|uniref:helix-hairpin-helix domain-containing protein n=1 Tax=Paenibacillus pinistramenti TaxID=1768003 RepID=UPI0011086051|nr:helix-hairpin-helix domain-containing protein [Paenibacillus pinistramenti]
MSTLKTPKLDLSPSERKALRSHNIRLNELHTRSVEEIRTILNITETRAAELRASSEFQRLPSIGPRFAEDLIRLGFCSLDDLSGQNGAELFDRLEALAGQRIDPCVEDQLRLVVFSAEHRTSGKQWWDFTEERKLYRSLHGYPADRPE